MRCAIFGTGPRATHVVLAGDRVPAGTVLVTPGVHYTNDKKKIEMNQKEREYFVSSQRKSYQAV